MNRENVRIAARILLRATAVVLAFPVAFILAFIVIPEAMFLVDEARMKETPFDQKAWRSVQGLVQSEAVRWPMANSAAAAIAGMQREQVTQVLGPDEYGNAFGAGAFARVGHPARARSSEIRYDPGMSKPLRVRVENGRLVGEAPAGLPDGTEFDVVLAAGDDDLDDRELDALNDVLGASLKQVKAGDGIDADELHRRLRGA